MKKTIILLAVLCMALLLTGCTDTSNQVYYERAQLYLGSGDCRTAADLFSQLGEYEDSADYALYCAGLLAIEEGEYALARANLEEVHPFKSSERYLRYLDALAAEHAGSFDEALALYDSLGSFEGSQFLAEALREAIPERKLQQARTLMSNGAYAEAREILLALEGYGNSAVLAENCTVALNKAAYSEADALYEGGDLLSALEAFEALGDTLDAAERAAECRTALYGALEEQYAAVTLDTAAGLIVAYAAIDEDFAQQRAAELQSRFGANLALLEAADELPYVMLGAYPTGESGVERELRWRVIHAEGTTLTLLCDVVIDAAPIATSTDLTLTEAERIAVTTAQLPSFADLAALSDLSCAATPYALAQGVAQEEDAALYWLRDSLESGVHPVVDGDGVLAIPGDEDIPGIRPMITLNLTEYTFTSGDGSLADPFR
ncbi:MAG: hypothetical protein IJ438_02840 [Clostridia bacterium]|nr:hypothetical protein [Clostridia bacterium]